MIRRFRQWSGKQLIAFGIRVHGHTVLPVETTKVVNKITEQSTAAVVEYEPGNDLQWSPTQKGNVVIVEPPLMHKYRRNKL